MMASLALTITTCIRSAKQSHTMMAKSRIFLMLMWHHLGVYRLETRNWRQQT